MIHRGIRRVTPTGIFFGAWIGTLLAVVYVGRKFKAIGLLGYGVIQLIGAGLVAVIATMRLSVIYWNSI